MRLISLTGAETVQHPELGTAEVGEDGVFDVPEELGNELVKHAGMWQTEAEHIAARARAELADLSDPNKVPEILRAIRQRVSDNEDTQKDHADQLEAANAKIDEHVDQLATANARIAELEQQVEQLTAAATDPGKHEATETEPEGKADGDAEPAAETPAKTPASKTAGK